MTPAIWIALTGTVMTLLANVGGWAVAYGILRGTVTALALRVSALEAEMNALGELKIKVTEIATRQEIWIEQLKELNASIRWMRDPASYEPSAPSGVSPPRRRSPG